MPRPENFDATRQPASHDATRQPASYDATRMRAGDNTRSATADEQKRRDDVLRDIVRLRGGGGDKGKEKAKSSNPIKALREKREKKKEADEYEDKQIIRLNNERNRTKSERDRITSEIRSSYNSELNNAFNKIQELSAAKLNNEGAQNDLVRLRKIIDKKVTKVNNEYMQKDEALQSQCYRKIDNKRIQLGLKPKYSKELQKLPGASAIPGSSHEVGELISDPQATVGGDYPSPSQAYGAGGDYPSPSQAYGAGGDYAGYAQPYAGGDYPSPSQGYGAGGDHTAYAQPYAGGDYPSPSQAYGAGGDHTAYAQPENLNAQMARMALSRRDTVYNPDTEDHRVPENYSVSPIDEESRPGSVAEGER